MFKLLTLKEAFYEDWDTRRYSLDPDTAIQVSFSSVPSCPDFIQHHVAENIHDLLSKQRSERPSASEMVRIFSIYCEFLQLSSSKDLDVALPAAVNHPSYLEWKELLKGEADDHELLYSLASRYEMKNEINILINNNIIV